MKIAIDAREYTTSTGRYMFRLVQYLEKIESEHEFVVLLKPHDMDVYPLTNPRFTKAACPHKEFTFEEQIAFKKQLEDLQPDLVHFGMVQQPIWYKGNVVTTMQDLTTIRFRNPAKNPLIFTFKQEVYKWVNLQAAKKSTAIITPSEYVKQDVVNFTGVDPMKITVTYEAADKITDNPEPISELIDNDFIMYIGRPTPHKNLERLISAFAEIQETKPNLHLVLAGKKDSNYARIQASVAKREIQNVLFTGFISDGQLRWLYEHTAAYIFPSLSEGFGLPGVEAMIHGAPVVSSYATCLPEILGDAAHYFDPLDTVDIATKIVEVLDSSTLRDSLVSKGMLQAASYSWERMAHQTLAVYNHALRS